MNARAHVARHHRRGRHRPPPLHRPLQESRRMARPGVQRPLQPPLPYQPWYHARYSCRGWRRRGPLPRGWLPGRTSGRVHRRRCRQRSHQYRWLCRGWPLKPLPFPRFLEPGVEAGGRGRARQLPRWSHPPAGCRGRARQLPRSSRLPARHPLAMQPRPQGRSSPAELSPLSQSTQSDPTPRSYH
jgi:hypothetical protein